MSVPVVPTGPLTVQAPCPECGEIQPIRVDLASVLSVAEGEDAVLKVRLRGKPSRHDCGWARAQQRLEFGTADEGEVPS